MTIRRVMTLFLLLLALPVQAARVINSVELNGAATTVVSPGSSITVTITVTTSGSGSNDNWDSTSYTLDGVTTCVNTSDFSSDGTYAQVFTITAPATDGSYTISFYAHRNAGCSPPSDSNNYSITDGIEVTTGGGSGDCPALFPDAVSSNDAGGSISFASFSSVSNSPDNILETTNIVDSFFSTSCSTTDCSASGSVVGTVSNSAFPGGSDISVGGFGSQTVPPGDYGSITAGSFSTLTLTAGGYTLSGDLNIAHLVISGLGTVRIWVNGEVNINGFSNVNNPGGADQLVIFANGDVSIGTFSTVNAVIYSNSDVVVGSGTAVTGAVTGNSVNLESWSNVSFDSAALGSTDFGALCSATPIAEYHFDELAWNGAAGEVVDNTGNGLNGRAVNGATTSDTTPDPARTGNPGTCRYADLNGGTQYVEVADNNQLDMPTELTVTVWIYPRSLPPSGLMTILSKDTNYEFHLNPSGQINWWWNSAGGATQQFSTTGPQLNPDTWYHVAIVYTNGDQRIYINGVEQGFATFTGNLITNNIPLLIGTDTGFVGSRNFDGPIDEVKIFNQALSVSEVQVIYAETHPCAITGPDHFDIDHGGTAIYCATTAVNVTAEDAANGTVTTYIGTITIDTNSGLGDWSAPTANGVIDNGTANDGIATYTFDSSDNGVVEFLLNHSDTDTTTPLAMNISVTDGSASDDDLEGLLNFSASGFTVTGSALVNNPPNPINTNLPIANQVAGTDFQIYLAAYGETPEDPSCGVIESYSGSRQITYAVTYDDPGTGTIVPTINGNAIASPIATNFVAGQASVTAKYKDVGSIQLVVSDGSIVGSSNNFVVSPHIFQIVFPAETNPAAVDASGDPFTASAGTDFDVVVYVRDSEGALTPNYGNESAPESVTISYGLADISLSFSGTLTGTLTRYSDPAEWRGTYNWNEVGIITMTGQVGDGDYLGAGNVTTDLNVGRFIPAYFELGPVASVVPANTNSTNFTYFGQAFSVNYTVIAKAAGGDTTQNYEGDYAKLDVNDEGRVGDANTVDIRYGAVNTTTSQTYNDSSRLILSNVAMGTAWDDGELDVANLELTIARGSTREVPAPDVSIGVDFRDSDGVTFNGLNLDSSTTGVDSVLIGTLPGGLFYGRIFIPPVYGPEINAGEVTPIPFEVQYYNGSSFVVNTIDSSTRYGAPATMMSGTTSNHTNNINPSDVTSADIVFPVLIPVEDGRGGMITIARPGANKDGTVDVTFPVEPWLQYNWDNVASEPDDENPTTTVTFGSYRGHDRIIYWRELH